MVWRVEVAARAEKDLAGLDAGVRRRVVKALARLASDPLRGANIKKLSGAEELYRLRVGDYRVLYAVREALLLVLVVRVGHRREVYRRG